MLGSEWRADSQALASDGQYWRSVYGGARLVLGTIRCTPRGFAALRLLLTMVTGLIFFMEASCNPVDTRSWLIYFNTWTILLQCIYFVLALSLTIIAVCTASSGIERSTPFAVRLTEFAYGALLPASWINSAVNYGVQYAHRDNCVPRTDSSDQYALAVLSGCALTCVMLDACFNRQPYYASFHAVVGIIFCWGWLLFSIAFEGLGGALARSAIARDEHPAH